MKIFIKIVFFGAILVVLGGVGRGLYHREERVSDRERADLLGSEASTVGNQNQNGAVMAAKTFEDSQKLFSLQYPSDFMVSELPPDEDGLRTATFESNQARRGFELTVFPFNEEGPITAERIKKDLPEAVIHNPKTVAIGGGVPALTFQSEEEDIGDTREIWFVRAGYFYQATAYRDFGAQLEEIMKTIEFK